MDNDEPNASGILTATAGKLQDGSATDPATMSGIEPYADGQSPLNVLIARLISKITGISPEKVTTEYIHVYRETTLYPTARHQSTSGYGGIGRKALTATQVIAQREGAEAFFKGLANGTKG